MKRITVFVTILISLLFISTSKGNSEIKPNAIDAVKLTSDDIPEGFMYGKVPEVYKKTLKDNPWMMDKAAIRHLADKIYPGGDYNKIAGIHISIIANKNKPYNDDIVCYIILFNSMKAAMDELKKVNEYTGYNRDRVILLSKENLAVFMFVDNANNFHYIQELAKKIDERLKCL